MKRIIVLLFALVLCACASAEGVSAVEMSFTEDSLDYTRAGAIELGEDAELLWKTEFGYVSVSADGGYVYHNDEARTPESGAVDTFMISYSDEGGVNYTRAVSVKIAEEYALEDGIDNYIPRGESCSGTAVREGLFTDDAAFATKFVKFCVNENGEYTVLLRNWAEDVQAVSGGEKCRDEMTLVIKSADGTLVEHVFGITVKGKDEAPEIGDAEDSLLLGSAVEVSGTLAKDGFKFSQPDGQAAKYGLLILGGDGSYTYIVDQDNVEVSTMKKGEVLTEKLKFIAAGAGGSVERTLTIKITMGNKVPEVSNIDLDLTEGNVVDIRGNVFSLGSKPGNGTQAEQTVTWQGASTVAATELKSDGSYKYTPDNDKLRHLAEGETMREEFTFTITDTDGDSVSAKLIVTIHGANSVPAVKDLMIEIDEDDSGKKSIDLTSAITAYGDGSESGHKFNISLANIPTWIMTLNAESNGKVSASIDTSVSSIYSLKDGEFATYEMAYTLADGDADKSAADTAQGKLIIKVLGKSRKPSVSSFDMEVSMNSFTDEVDAADYVTLGEGPLSAHTISYVGRENRIFDASLSLENGKFVFRAKDDAFASGDAVFVGTFYTFTYKIKDADGSEANFTFRAKVID